MAKPTLVLALVAALAALASAPSPAAAQAPTCKLAEPPPPPPDPSKPRPTTCDADKVCQDFHPSFVCIDKSCVLYESPRRQECEDELAKDDLWWRDLEARLRTQIHVQTAKEVTTNNRHVVMAYGAIWIIAVAFIVLLWRKQVALRAEIDRLSRELAKAEGGDSGGGGGEGAS